VVEVPEGCEIPPPRLGKTGGAELYLRRIRKLEGIPRPALGEDDRLEEGELVKPTPDKATLAA
jgi:hypothetical protein